MIGIISGSDMETSLGPILTILPGFGYCHVDFWVHHNKHTIFSVGLKLSYMGITGKDLTDLT